MLKSTDKIIKIYHLCLICRWCEGEWRPDLLVCQEWLAAGNWRSTSTRTWRRQVARPDPTSLPCSLPCPSDRHGHIWTVGDFTKSTKWSSWMYVSLCVRRIIGSNNNRLLSFSQVLCGKVTPQPPPVLFYQKYLTRWGGVHVNVDFIIGNFYNFGEVFSLCSHHTFTTQRYMVPIDKIFSQKHLFKFFFKNLSIL